MSEMIETIAKTIQEVTPGGEFIEWDDAVLTARCILKRMREPTEEMVNSPMARCYNDGPYADKEVRRIFSAMIDVALGERT